MWMKQNGKWERQRERKRFICNSGLNIVSTSTYDAFHFQHQISCFCCVYTFVQPSNFEKRNENNIFLLILKFAMCRRLKNKLSKSLVHAQTNPAVRCWKSHCIAIVNSEQWNTLNTSNCEHFIHSLNIFKYHMMIKSI